MNYYILKDEKIVLFDEDKEKLETTLTFMPEYQGFEILETDRPIENFEFADTEEFQAKKTKEERERLDSLTLTPADVERALYSARGMDFEDLKTLITEQIPSIDLKGLAIEFRAKDFWRGAELKDGTRIFDIIGALLGYTPDDMDYLFENKELPVTTTEGAQDLNTSVDSFVEDEEIEDD